ncbi:MAG: serine hydrolase domain-containing protein [Gammaproteobacteria bacterium]
MPSARRISKRFLAALITALLAVHSPAFAAGEGEADYYNYDFEPFLSWLKAATDERKIPGAAVAIVTRDGIVHLDTWGVKNTSARSPIAVDSVFRIASMSKTFAGTAATLIVDQQLQSWDSPLAELFPALQIGPQSNSNAITLRHVASHSTGLMPHSYSNMLDAGVSYDKIKQQFAKIPRVCDPGDCYGYQNVVFSLIADVVEEKTGDSYARFIEHELFEPLGMMTASVGFEAYSNNKTATSPHRKSRNGWRPTTTNPAYYTTAPAAGINASVYDMTLWLRANLGAFPDVLPPETLFEIQRPVVETPYGNYFNRWQGLEKAYYALGWRVLDYKGLRAIHHGGGVRGYRSEMVFVPEANIGMVVLLNAESNVANDFVPAFLDNLSYTDQ